MMSATEGELDIELTHDREEGELEDSDVEEGAYIPLARPETFNPPSLVRMQIQDEQSDDGSPQDSSESESEDERQRRPKRIKLKVRRPPPNSSTDKKEKYNVWCKALQEDLLTEDMVTFDVSKKCRYGVESYDYSMKYRLNKDYEPKTMTIFTNEDKEDNGQSTNKRKFSDRANVKLRLGKRINSHHQNEKPIPKFIPDLVVISSDPVETIAGDIADKLREEKKELIGRIIEAVGSSKAIDIYKQTQKIEAEGGMLVVNGTRRRTPGGVYFFLLKHDEEVPQETLNQVFNEDRKQTARTIKRARAKSRQKVVEQLKQSLTDSELPSLMSRGEVATQSEHGSNPPPSPATDARDCSSDTDAHSHTEAPAPSPARPHSPLPDRTESRQLQDYEDDDYLEVMCNDDMDLF